MNRKLTSTNTFEDTCTNLNDAMPLHSWKWPSLSFVPWVTSTNPQINTHNGQSFKEIAVAFGKVANTSATALLPMMQLCSDARCTHILPALTKNSLLGVGTFANVGCHYFSSLQWWCNNTWQKQCCKHNQSNGHASKCWDANGLWCLPLLNLSHNTCFHDPPCICNIYELSLTNHMVCYLHVTLEFPTKATLLSANKTVISPCFPVTQLPLS